MDVSLPAVGAATKRLSDCDWSMNAPRSAAMSMTDRILISHTVLYTSLSFCGISGMFCTEPWNPASACQR
eukprot:2564548-Rhodomonas_salina.6